MKLVLDMHISPVVAVELRSIGYDVFQLRERGLQKLSDEGIIELAVHENRVVVTFDLDFTAHLARSNASLPSLVQFRNDDARTVMIIALLKTILVQYEAELKAGSIIIIDADRVRTRRLPIFGPKLI